MIKNLITGAFLCTVAALFAAMPLAAIAQDDADEAKKIDVSAVPTSAERLEGFVPAGWKIEEDVTGDLNGDGVADHALKLIEDKPAVDKEDRGVNRSRALVIVFAGRGGGLTLGTVADSLLQCTGCGGAFYGVSDAPANVTIEKGVLVVSQDHGSRDVTETTYRFRYDEQPSMFILIGFDYVTRDRATGGFWNESTNYLTGKRVTIVGKGKRDVTKKTVVAKKRFSIGEVDGDKFEEDATKRLGLD
ncbi:hypothetical protein BH10ACI3_BH10ACI3_13780 [soil metagenome]